MGAELNNRRKLIVSLGAGALTIPFASIAQQQSKVWHLGYLDFGSRQSVLDSGRYTNLIEGLRDRGYIEGKNLALDVRFADGNAERLNLLAAELVRMKVDLILSQGTPASHAAKLATTTIPIVIVATTDPVGDGFAKSLARPGGNITGMSSSAEDTVQKLVELLMIAVPRLTRIAVAFNPTSSAHTGLLSRVRESVKKAGKQVLPMGARTAPDIERGFATIVRERGDGMIIFADSFLFSERRRFAELALTHRLPSIHALGGFAEVGGLMSYGADINENYRRAGIFVDKILKGAKIGDIPFEQPTRYYFALNRKTANALGVKLTGELLARADKVIE
ncbi:MAG: transporter substrate-binding protein [Herminiimonas sp.]|nr:transporter substrate-binding protein [Herminiimonas sp.]